MFDDGMTPKGRMAIWCADESGAARMDRAVLVFGVLSVTALLAFSMIGQEEHRTLAEAGGTSSAAAGEGAVPADLPQQRVISATGRTVPEPPRVEGVEVHSSYASSSYLERFEPRHDNELAILTAQTQQAMAEEEAARAAAAAAAPADSASETGAASGADGS
jgi:hypothetical protein